MSFTRRDMLLLAGAVGMAPIANFALSGGLPSAVAIGRAWLGDEPAPERRLAALLAEVMPFVRDDDDWLHDRIARDFVEANVVMVDGWMLSAIEARLCGIAYLSGKARI